MHVFGIFMYLKCVYIDLMLIDRARTNKQIAILAVYKNRAITTCRLTLQTVGLHHNQR